VAALLEAAGHAVTRKPGWMGEFRIKVDGRDVFNGGERAKGSTPEAIVATVKQALTES